MCHCKSNHKVQTSWRDCGYERFYLTLCIALRSWSTSERSEIHWKSSKNQLYVIKYLQLHFKTCIIIGTLHAPHGFPNDVTIYSFMVVGFLSSCFTTHCLFSFSAPGVNHFMSVIPAYCISITPSSISGNKKCISALTSKVKVCFSLSLHNSKQVYSWMHYFTL